MRHGALLAETTERAAVAEPAVRAPAGRLQARRRRQVDAVAVSVPAGSSAETSRACACLPRNVCNTSVSEQFAKGRCNDDSLPHRCFTLMVLRRWHGRNVCLHLDETLT